ncbi:MAG: ribonuclease J [Bacilli bacterium]
MQTNDNKILSSPLKIYALGGLEEVGKNTYVIESDNHLIIIDAGVRFPEENLVGVDYVVPDYTQLKNNQGKIRALFITHGHEDHIGGIPFLIQSINIPVIYAPRLAAALIRNKLEEHRIKDKVKIIEYEENDIITAGDFTVSFFRVTHSIPDSYGIVVDHKNGRIVTTGDFKIDLTPVGPDINLRKIARIGEEGVDLLLADSTNADKEGYTPSEKNVVSSINEIFSKATGRLIVSTFSSNISRIQQIVDAAVKFKRKLAIIGRSMENVTTFARKYGYVSIPDSSVIDIGDISSYRPNEILVLCTGSQGEPMAALSRIANADHRYLHIQPGDTVVFSSSPIPGNTVGINRVVNTLTRCGAEVITNSLFSDIHSSGHPAKQELRLMLKLMNPKYFMPAHGEFYMLKSHANLAISLGMPKENTFICANGDVLLLQNHKVREGIKVQADDIFIDGNDINGINTAIIRDRRILKEDGMVEVLVAIDAKNNKLLTPPVIKTLGFVADGAYKNHLIRHASAQVQESLESLMATGKVTFGDIKNNIKSVSSKYFFRKTQRNPMIIPVIMNKNQ